MKGSRKLQVTAITLIILCFTLLYVINFMDGIVRDILGITAFVCLLSFFPLMEIGVVIRIKEHVRPGPLLALAIASTGIAALAFLGGMYVILNLSASSLFPVVLFFEFYLFLCLAFLAVDLLRIYFKDRRRSASISVPGR